MKKIGTLVMVAALVGVAYGGQTVTEVATRFGTAECARLKECAGAEAFAAVYPKGDGQGVDVIVNAVSAGKDGSAHTTCTDSDVSACTTDIKNQSCDSTTGGQLPSSCTKC